MVVKDISILSMILNKFFMTLCFQSYGQKGTSFLIIEINPILQEVNCEYL